jgi:hypothetical protein
LLARISHDNGRTWDRAETLAGSGANAHGGYPNVNGADTRLAFTWTTSSAAVLRLYRTSTERWGANSVFARFPDDQPGVGSTLNKGGLGPVALLKPRTTTIGIVWTECNRTTKGICIDNYPQASDRNAEMQLLYRESNDNGGSWGRASRIDAPARKYVQLDWAWGVFVGNTPYAYYNAHNAAYGYYQMRLKVCSGC